MAEGSMAEFLLVRAGSKASAMATMDLPGKEAYRSSHVDLSPAATTIAFDPVLPPVRVPVPAGEGDDPSKGPYVLAFRSEETWRDAMLNCADKIADQCEAGAKVGCSISAAKACRAPWWEAYLPFLKSGRGDQSSREECEEREMAGCLASSQEQCTQYAREICDPVFANMRIAAPGAPVDPRFNGKRLRLPRVSRHDKIVPKPAKKTAQATGHEESPRLADERTTPGVHSPAAEEKRPGLGVTTFRGQLLMRNERSEERGRRPLVWSPQGTPQSAQPSPSEGWVGGLVHPGAVKSGAADAAGAQNGVPALPMSTTLEWWQKLQQLVIEKFSF